MSRTIWKFTLGADCTHEIPAGSQILSVREQHGEVCMWAVVDPGYLKVVRRFVLVGTGHPLPADATLKFLGTAQLDQGFLVLHAFEVLP